MRQVKYLYVVLLLLLGACAALEKPKTFQEQMLYTQYGLVGAVEIAANMKEQGKLDPGQVEQIAEWVTNADKALKMARGFSYQGKPKDALEWLNTANGILVQLETYLRSRQ
jgi:hypothetical protein